MRYRVNNIDNLLNKSLKHYKSKNPTAFAFFMNWKMYENFKLTQYNDLIRMFRKNDINIQMIPILTDKSTSFDKRVNSLKSQIERICDKNDSKVNLISYSLAGIDSRIFISMLGGDSYINTLFTISTPHLGSRLATILKESTLHANHQLVVEPAIRSLGVNYDMFLTEFNQTNIRELNKTVVDSPNVNYVSVGSKKLQIKGSESLRVTQEIVADSITEDFSNDGIVAAKESVWGTHLINFDADHFELIGMRPEFSAREMFNFYSNVAKYYDADFKKEVKA